MQFHVHHLTYERVGDEFLSDLQLLCEPCHEFIHGHSDHDPCRIPSIDELMEMLRPPPPSVLSRPVTMTVSGGPAAVVTVVEEEESDPELERLIAEHLADL